MNWIKVANFFGVFNKARMWMQGKKTYVAAAIKALTALSLMFTTLGTIFGVLAQILGESLGWLSGSMSFGQMSDSITAIVQQHAVLMATFTAAWWALVDAFSDAAKYAAANRRQIELVIAKQTEQKPGRAL